MLPQLTPAYMSSIIPWLYNLLCSSFHQLVIVNVKSNLEPQNKALFSPPLNKVESTLVITEHPLHPFSCECCNLCAFFFCRVTLESSSFYFGNSIYSSFQPTRGKKQNKYDKIAFHTQLSTRQSLPHNIISQNNQLSGNISLCLQCLCACLSLTRYPGFHRWRGAPWDAVVGYHCN